ncbi:MAG: pyridoxine 5'-phosphate synthase [Nitrospirae bacterium]|nr:pyridoxine 5'-phosphate synthase [Nitrospirota bacterium]
MILGVNIDHVATLRQARGGIEPDPVMAVTPVVLGGADGITIHLREDRRHIQDRDLKLLREIVPVELNLEMAATKEMIAIALQVKPDMVTFVPEKRQELTTEGGLDVKSNMEALKLAVNKLQDKGIPVSLFINPEFNVVETSKKIGAKMVEIHTGSYSISGGAKMDKEFEKVLQSIKSAADEGLEVNAGQLYIGHSIISRAVFVGLERAVREMKELMEGARRGIL